MTAPTGLAHNADIAAAFDELADLLEVRGDNPFRARAFRTASRIVSELPLAVSEALVRGEALPRIPGIGDEIQGKIAEIASTGTCTLLEELRARPCADVVPASRPGKERRFALARAAEHAEPLARYLGAFMVGSYRRMKETVGDLEFLAASEHPAEVIERFARYPAVAKMIVRGPAKAAALLACGIPCQLRVVPPESFGAALHFYTGSRAHNAALRKLAEAHGLKVNELGVFRGRSRVAGDTEESVYAAVGLPYIAPELREDRGEIQAAMRGRLSRLVVLEDLAGDLHVHTRATDGRSSLAEMVAAARAAGLKYVAITDHSRSAAAAHGLDSARLARQGVEIDALNAGPAGVHVLKGVEVDILEDGSLDLPDAALEPLDIVVAAVHSALDLSPARQTERILAALDNPHVDLLAHPTGRLLGIREALDVDMLAIMRKAKSRGIALELNAHPDRLDLNDVHARMARDEGVALAIDSDAHAADGFAALRYGVGQARRGWLTREDVLNTRPAVEMKQWLTARRAESPAR